MQISGLSNWTTADATGIQAAGIVNVSDNMRGLQLAGVVNFADDAMYQIAFGGNRADNVNGLQLSAGVDYNSMQGVQIGALNIIQKGPVRALLSAQSKQRYALLRIGESPSALQNQVHFASPGSC